MTIWVTRHALTRGIEKYDDAEARVIRSGKGDRHCVVIPGRPGRKQMRFWPREWHPTAEAAVSRAEEMRQSALASLARQAEKLAALKFRIPR